MHTQSPFAPRILQNKICGKCECWVSGLVAVCPHLLGRTFRFENHPNLHPAARIHPPALSCDAFVRCSKFRPSKPELLSKDCLAAICHQFSVDRKFITSARSDLEVKTKFPAWFLNFTWSSSNSGTSLISSLLIWHVSADRSAFALSLRHLHDGASTTRAHRLQLHITWDDDYPVPSTLTTSEPSFAVRSWNVPAAMKPWNVPIGVFCGFLSYLCAAVKPICICCQTSSACASQSSNTMFGLNRSSAMQFSINGKETDMYIDMYIYIYAHMFHAFMYPRNHCIILLPDVSWTPLSCDLKAQWFQGEKWRITSQLTYFYWTEMLENQCHCCHFDIS